MWRNLSDTLRIEFTSMSRPVELMAKLSLSQAPSTVCRRSVTVDGWQTYLLIENCNINYADVAELADAPDLGSGISDVQVRFLSSAPRRSKGKLCFDFFMQKSHPPASLLLLFRKKSRSARLLGCKRPRNDSLSLPTFCEFYIDTL